MIYNNIVLLLFSCSVVSNSLQPRESQHARPPCPSPTPGVHPNSCPSSQWCHPAISFSAALLSSCLQSFPASGSFPMSWLFASGGQSIGASASASILSMNIPDWFPLGLISLLSTERSNGIILGHKKNEIVPFAVTWMGPETHTEWNKSEKNKYRILTHICVTWKDGIEELTWKAEIEKKA